MANAPLKRASDFIEGIGPGIDQVQNRDMVLRNFDVSNRPMRGESAVFCSIGLSELDSDGAPTDEVTQYHAWSESLAEKLNQIGTGNLPVIVQFAKERTGSGFQVWTIK